MCAAAAAFDDDNMIDWWRLFLQKKLFFWMKVRQTELRVITDILDQMLQAFLRNMDLLTQGERGSPKMGNAKGKNKKYTDGKHENSLWKLKSEKLAYAAESEDEYRNNLWDFSCSLSSLDFNFSFLLSDAQLFNLF